MFIMDLLFWFSIVTLLYTYVGFPLLVFCIGRLKNYQVEKKAITPTISLIIAAYNEEEGIAEKLENSLNLSYPVEALEIIVASDGSTDRTNEIVEQHTCKGVQLLGLPRRGKIYALNEAVAQSKGEIVVFSDANTLYHPQALKKIVANFADPEVGGVCGNQIYIKKDNRDNIAKGEGFYWNYDKWLKQLESLTGSIVAADGAIYAIRRELYQMPGSTATTDDFAISTGVIQRGLRLVFESEALAYEHPAASATREFKRKVRIIIRGLRGVQMRKNLLNPFKFGFYSLILFSHKLLRRLVPFFLLVLFIANAYLSLKGSFYFWAAVAQSIFYAWGGISYLLRNKPIGRRKIFYLPFFFCLANLAALVAIINIAAGKRIEFWEPQRQSAGL